MRKSFLSACFLAVLAATFLLSTPAAFADPNLVSWWRFDDGSGSIASDSAGSNNGEVIDALWLYDPCRGMCLSFDGDYDYVLVGDNDNLEQQAFTLSFWARFNYPSDGLQGGIAKGNIFRSPADFSYKIEFDSGVAMPAVTNTSDIAFGTSGIIEDSNWHMWSMTVVSGTLTLYKDGAFVNSTSYTGGIDYTKNSNDFVIGAQDNGNYSFNGQIDDVRFYDKALSAGEIWQLYQKGLGDIALAFAPNPPDGSTHVDADIVLSWSPGGNAISHDVYFGTDSNDVNNATHESDEYMGNPDVNTYAPPRLVSDTTYYWRIDEVNPSGTAKGNVWNFKTGMPEIGFSATQFLFLATLGGPNPDVQVLGISNSGQCTLNWQISGGCGWLSVEPNSGSSTGEVDGVNLTVDISGLTAGTYNCNLMISDVNASNNPQTAAVTLYVIDPNGILFVPSEYPTIQAAIDASVDGNIVIVFPEIYTGLGNRDIDFHGKAITVRSVDPNAPNIIAATVIDCQGTADAPHRGFYFHNGEDANSVVAGFTILNGYANDIGGGGGGIRCDGSSPMITNCAVIENISSAWGGGGMYCLDSSPVITNCNISGNLASGYGGQGGGMLIVNHSSPIVTGCTFTSNSAAGDWRSGSGGGMANVRNCNPTVTNCIFAYNSSIGNGGGMFNEENCNPVVKNCLFYGNSCPYSGGAICNFNDSNTVVICCTFTGNSAGGGGAIFSRDSNPTVTNCIIWNNPAVREIYVSSGTVTVSYSDIKNGWAGTDNIDADPCFVTGPDGNYYLSQIASGQAGNSPCVNTGSDTAANLGMDVFTTRTDSIGDMGIVDMGYHHPFFPNPDLNGDASINLIDYAILANQWMLKKLSFDIAPDNGDGIVNFLDYAGFADGWLNVNDTNDLADFASQWLQRGSFNADITPAPNGDGIVDFSDLAVLCDNWLKTF